MKKKLCIIFVIIVLSSTLLAENAIDNALATKYADALNKVIRDKAFDFFKLGNVTECRELRVNQDYPLQVVLALPDTSWNQVWSSVDGIDIACRFNLSWAKGERKILQSDDKNTENTTKGFIEKGKLLSAGYFEIDRMDVLLYDGQLTFLDNSGSGLFSEGTGLIIKDSKFIYKDQEWQKIDDYASANRSLKYDEAAKVIKTVPLEYPSFGPPFRTGQIDLEVEVLKNGSVGRIVFKKSLEVKMDKASAEAIRKWKFNPAKFENKPVDSWISFPIEFTK